MDEKVGVEIFGTSKGSSSCTGCCGGGCGKCCGKASQDIKSTYCELQKYIESTDICDKVDIKFFDVNNMDDIKSFSEVKKAVDEGYGFPFVLINGKLRFYGGISGKVLYYGIKEALK